MPEFSPAHSFSSLASLKSELRALAVPARVVRLLENPPIAGGGNLSLEQQHQFVAHVRQIVEHACTCERTPPFHFINAPLQRAASAYFSAEREKGWRLLPISDLLRAGEDRRYIFGQVPDGPDRTAFKGYWMAENDDGAGVMVRRLPIIVRAEAQLIGTPRWPNSPLREREMRALEERGEESHLLQVDADSPLGRWASVIFRSSKTGYIDGFHPLGVVAEAVQRAAERGGVSGLLLPRSRRDPAPPMRHWARSSFLKQEGGLTVWRGAALQHGVLVVATFAVSVSAEIAPEAALQAA